jgi:CPA2 family monovalent cation:H+ antiporter-2
VVSEYLKKNQALRTSFGTVILNMLLLQDIMLAPLLTLFQFMEKSSFSLTRLLTGIAASIAIFLLLRAVRSGKHINPMRLRFLSADHELQVFLGGAVCLGFGLLASLAGLSASIGSFVAGLLIGRTKALAWLEQTLRPFRVFFVAFFFMSIGLQLDLPFLAEHYPVVLLGTVCLLLSNSLLSAFVFRMLQYSWKQSFYGGALLSQAGEFGLLACSIAFRAGIIDVGFFKIAVAITALSLLLSTSWISLLRRLAHDPAALLAQE